MRNAIMGGLYLVVLSVVSMLVSELALRSFFAFKVGPSVLLYGTRYSHDVRHFDEAFEPAARPDNPQFRANLKFRRENQDTVAWRAHRTLRGYTKYHPNQVRVDRDPATGERFNVTINSSGFRGQNFEIERKPGVVRVLTLGSSSTFGYFNRDHETYPYVLEHSLNEQCNDEQSYEVINLGVPHLRAHNIHALLLAEGIQLKPDVVTYYAGRNDSLKTIPPRHEGTTVGTVVAALRPRLISVAFLDSLLDFRGLRLSEEEFALRSREVSRFFLAHLSQTHEECSKRGILFIVVSQQGKSSTIERGRMSGLTYAQEVELVRNRMHAGGVLSGTESSFLGHSVIMRDLRDWVIRRNVPFVDAIAALDRDRDTLMSWVHLNPKGNRLIARALSQEILKHTCPANRY